MLVLRDRLQVQQGNPNALLVRQATLAAHQQRLLVQMRITFVQLEPIQARVRQVSGQEETLDSG